LKKAFSLFTIMMLTLVFNLPLTAKMNAGNELSATISGIGSGDISKEILLRSGEILCSDKKYKVVSFTIKFIKNKDLIELYGFGNNLNTLMKKVIKGIRPGQQMIVKDIKAKDRKGKTVTLPVIELYLK
jgi:hypothetical protein